MPASNAGHGVGEGEGAPPYVIFKSSTIAKTAAITVEMKFTSLFPSSPRRSSVAPRKLSASIPATPAPAQIGNACHANRRIRTPTRLTATAPAIPASVPAEVIAPFVPAVTSLQFVTRCGLPPNACPISLDTVSAAASEVHVEAGRRLYLQKSFLGC